MCGINGEVHRESAYPINQEHFLAQRDLLTHRGPDDAGCYFAGGVALGSRRLAILDLSARGHMPMSTVDGRFWIVYNGEVYNFGELRRSLEQRGCRFVSNTDTEVLLQLYAIEGPAMLTRLNGMFAIAIWDSQKRALFLARDRLGVKPLYFTSRGGDFYFASEEKALFAPGMVPRFDPDTWEELLCFRYVAGESTPFVGVKRLLAGHYLIWEDGEFETRRWWNLAERAQALRENLPGDPIHWYRETFDDAVRLRLISDVPVGLLLSGGLDSSSIAGSLGDQGVSGIACFTVGFTETGYDERSVAQQVTDRWHYEYHQLTLPRDELATRLQRATWLNDEPLVHANELHLWSVSEYAKPRVTVLLSGEGADETLNGYVRYKPLRYPRLLNGTRRFLPLAVSALSLNRRWRKLSQFTALGSIEEKYLLYNACNILPADLREIGMTPTERFPFRARVLEEARELYPGDFLRQAMYSDQHTFLCSLLDRNDRMVMGASIECRVPFLDYRLVEMLAALPSSVLISGHKSKSLLRNAMGNRLPDAVLRHKKWGFGVPWTDYLRQVPELRTLLADLPDLPLFGEGPFELSKIRTLIDTFLAGENRHEELVKQLMMIAVWHQAFFSNNKQSAAKVKT